jgi:hypothetical protein
MTVSRLHHSASRVARFYVAAAVVAAIVLQQVEGFSITPFGLSANSNPLRKTSSTTKTTSTTAICSSSANSEQVDPSLKGKFSVDIGLPPKNSGLVARIICEPVMNVPSELVEVRYDLPFGLDVEPQGGLAVCTKPNSGKSTNGNAEKPGDVLRYASAWSMGLPRGDGLLTQGGAFAGALSWQCNLFDVVKAKAWQQVIESLTSNNKDRTDEVVLIFERALPEDSDS